MPQFSYSALDQAGKTVQGVLDAATENDLVVRLSSQGLRVQSLARQTPAPMNARSPGPVAQRATPQASIPPHAATAPLVRPALRLAPASESELFFFFTQLSNLLRSGVPTTEALNTITQRHRKPDQAKAYTSMAQMTAKGSTLADAMAQFDEIFPPGAVGAVRAGETGGYVWEACAMVAEHMNNTVKLRRIAFWFSLMFWSSVLSLPVLGVAAVAIDRMVQAIDNGRQPLQELGFGLLQGLVGPWGLLTIALCAGFIFLNWFLRKPRFREFRHGIAARTPLMKKRAEGECLSAFHAHLSRLGKAGLSPYTSWKLAAAAVPNLAVGEKLTYAGSTMHENTRLSQVVYSSNIFPHELGPLIENGELTGGLPQALDQAAEIGRAQAQHAETGLKWRLGCWVGLLMLFFSSLFFAVPYRALYESVFKHVMSEP